jgi:DNA repair protein RadA/Sms
MAKKKTRYVCRECGCISPKWAGKCPECGSWDSFDEEVEEKSNIESKTLVNVNLVKLSDIEGIEVERVTTGIGELDQVLGGGVVKGSVVLIGGEPGIGKSTIMLQVASILNKHKKVLYVSGEESPSQISLRADRLGLKKDDFYVVSTNDLDAVLSAIEKENLGYIVIDSIQTIHSKDITSAAGTVSQIKYITYRLVELAKSKGISVFIVGQVTKDGAIAGPKVLEHLVDTVLYFEGDYSRGLRILRAVKNRFGPTNEVGIFEMKNEGLVELDGFSLIDKDGNSPGRIFTPVMEGTRVFMVEIQALVTSTFYNFPKRNATGFDLNRLQMLVAILEKKVGLSISSSDIYLNVAGGLKINEPSADLAVCAAIMSSFMDKPSTTDRIFIGEVGLTGRVRNVSNIKGRLQEAEKFGFNSAVYPEPKEKIKQMTNLIINNITELRDFI